MRNFKIFTINPGSTSTKIALFENSVKVFASTISHSLEDLKRYPVINDQLGFRMDGIEAELEKNGVSLRGTDAFAARCGGTAGQPCGTYGVNELLLDDITSGRIVMFFANLGGSMAWKFSRKYGGLALVVNPPETDELQTVARMTGLKGVYRLSRVHALNQKEIALRYAAEQCIPYETLNLIIAHLGGGISVTAHRKGKMVDSTDNVNGDGPMTPTRAGMLPTRSVISLVSGTEEQRRCAADRMLKAGGLTDHLGVNDVRQVKQLIDGGNSYAKLVYDAMIYQIGKCIGQMAAVLQGEINAIILTGGIAHDAYLTDQLRDMIGFLAPVVVMAGEFEMEALASGALRVLTGTEKLKEYTGRPVWDGTELSR